MAPMAQPVRLVRRAIRVALVPRVRQVLPEALVRPALKALRGLQGLIVSFRVQLDLLE